jgi:hypothetical protein
MCNRNKTQGANADRRCAGEQAIPVCEIVGSGDRSGDFNTKEMTT